LDPLASYDLLSKKSPTTPQSQVQSPSHFESDQPNQRKPRQYKASFYQIWNDLHRSTAIPSHSTNPHSKPSNPSTPSTSQKRLVTATDLLTPEFSFSSTSQTSISTPSSTQVSSSSSSGLGNSKSPNLNNSSPQLLSVESLSGSVPTSNTVSKDKASPLPSDHNLGTNPIFYNFLKLYQQDYLKKSKQPSYKSSNSRSQSLSSASLTTLSKISRDKEPLDRHDHIPLSHGPSLENIYTDRKLSPSSNDISGKRNKNTPKKKRRSKTVKVRSRSQINRQGNNQQNQSQFLYQSSKTTDLLLGRSFSPGSDNENDNLSKLNIPNSTGIRTAHVGIRPRGKTMGDIAAPDTGTSSNSSNESTPVNSPTDTSTDITTTFTTDTSLDPQLRSSSSSYR